MCLNICFSFEILAMPKSKPISLYWLTDVSVCIWTACVRGRREVNFNVCTLASSGNFLWLYMSGGSGSAGGASCPLQSGGRLLRGYNMVGQVYCLARGCALVLPLVWAGTCCVWRKKNSHYLDPNSEGGECCSCTQLRPGIMRSHPENSSIITYNRNRSPLELDNVSELYILDAAQFYIIFSVTIKSHFLWQLPFAEH